jgi:predicted dehydrogenase
VSVRVGVVGTGFGARVVAPVFDATPGSEVVEVVSARDDAGVANLCDRADVDLVSIHSPPFLHVAHVRRALSAGHAVLCDKPFGIDAGQAETLLGAAEAAECLHLLNFEFRYDPVRVLVRDLVADGAIGAPEHVTWTHLSARTRVPLRPHGWLFEQGCGGGWIGAWGSHAVDALRVIAGEVVTARAERRTTITERPDADGNLHKCDAEDGFTAWLTLELGVSVTIDSTAAATASVAPRLTISGSEGVLECIADERVVVRRSDGSRDEHSRPESDEGDPHLVPMRRWAEVVRDAVEAGTAPDGAPTFEDGLACARVLDALRA